MRFIKLAIISCVFLFLLVTVFSFFVPSRIRISKAIDIQTTKKNAIMYLADPVKWKSWYPGRDSMEIFFLDGKVRGIRPVANPGRELLLTGADDSTVTAMFSRPGRKKIKMGWNIIDGQNINSVTVQWWMDLRLRWYPWEKFSSLFFENIYGAEMEQGLGNLKILLESRRSSIN